jgi:hypothetical protein
MRNKEGLIASKTLDRGNLDDSKTVSSVKNMSQQK